MDSMNYLVCENCGGYYLLKDGESSSDFDSCQCGGKLYLLEYTDDDEIKSPEIICRECGSLNNMDTAFCSSCGQILIPTKEIVSANNPPMKPKIGIFAGFAFIVISLVLLGFLL